MHVRTHKITNRQLLLDVQNDIREKLNKKLLFI